MSKYKSSAMIKRVANAFYGLKLVFFSEKNFIIEIIISILIIISACLLNFTITDICLLMVICTIILICELINSAIEYTLDAVYKNKYSRIVKMAKDISAGMVLLACLLSFVFGILLFGSYIIKL